MSATISASAAPASASSSSSSSSSAAPAASVRDRANEMVFFDIETNIFPIEVIEFGAIIVNKFSYVEYERVHTLIQPASGAISSKATKIHGITFDMLRQSPFFAAIAPRIHDALQGRIWVGHNITSFDIPHITKAFEACSLVPPTPAAILDTLPLVRRIFGKRAGDCKMATLGAYFNLGEEQHRAIDDSRMTLDAMKCIALHNLLEREMPDSFPKFIDPTPAKKEKDATAAAATTTTDAVDQLTNQLAETKITATNGTEKPKKEKKEKKARKESASFIDSSLLPASTAATSAAPATSETVTIAAPAALTTTTATKAAKPAAVAPKKEQSEDEGWVVHQSRKTLKHEADILAAKEAARVKKAQAKASAKAAQAKKQQHQNGAAASSSSAATNGNGSQSSQSSSQSSVGSTWSGLLKATSPITVTTPIPAAVKVATSSAAATTLTPGSRSPPLSPNAAPFKPAGLAAKIPTLPVAALSSSSASSFSSSSAPAAASSSPSPTSPPVLSAADLAALHSTIDYYCSNPSLKCSLVYGGGNKPGSARQITNFSWTDQKPRLFRASIVGMKKDDFPLTFASNKCISLTLIA